MKASKIEIGGRYWHKHRAEYLTFIYAAPGNKGLFKTDEGADVVISRLGAGGCAALQVKDPYE